MIVNIMISEECIGCSCPHLCLKCKIYTHYSKQVEELENRDWDKLLKRTVVKEACREDDCCFCEEAERLEEEKAFKQK